MLLCCCAAGAVFGAAAARRLPIVSLPPLMIRSVVFVFVAIQRAVIAWCMPISLVAQSSRAPHMSPSCGPVPAPAVSPAVSAEQATADFLRNTFDLLEFDPIEPDPVEPEPAAPAPVMAAPEGAIVNPALPGLEKFLEAIHSYRQRRAI